MTSPHVMVDLETAGKDPNALILSIGAAKFDPMADSIIDSFHIAVDLRQMPMNAHGFTVDPGTVAWWLAPERAEARVALDSVPKVDLASALDGFALWLGDPRNFAGVWGNGATFDNVILLNAFDKLNMERPWTYRQDRCFRTFNNLAKSVPFADFGVAHSALDDAISQALHMQKIVKHLGLTEVL